MNSTAMEALTAKADRNRARLKTFRALWDIRETIIIVPSQWAWAHFDISILQFEGSWCSCGSWQLSILGSATPFVLTTHYPSRAAAIRNQILHQRDHMLRSAFHRNDPSQIRQATTIATKVNAWLETYRATHRTPSPQQLEFAFS